MIEISNWFWPQWTIISLWLIILLLYANHHGKKVEFKANFWSKSIVLCILAFIFTKGGFFK